MKNCRLLAGLLVLLLVFASPDVSPAQSPPGDTLSLSPCELDGYPGPARCGHLRVPEDSSRPDGGTISLRVAQLPARSDVPAPDPVFVFAGGPGQAATDYAPIIGRDFEEVLEHRDVVLVDRRGTGGSGALRCPRAGAGASASPYADIVPEQIRSCRRALEKEADLTRYTTPFAVEDIDRVRRAMGYERINLYGASYGSREAMVYLRRHPEAVRSVLLEAVMPPPRRPMLQSPATAQQALDRLIDDCGADEPCRAAFPRLRADFDSMMARLERGPVEIAVPARRGAGSRAGSAEGGQDTVRMDRADVGGTLRTALIFPAGAARLPRLIHRAAHGDYSGLAELGALVRRATRASLPRGLFLSVVCAEEVARIEETEIGEATAGTFWGDAWVRSLSRQCAEWPGANLPVGYWRPVQSRVPVLMLSGWLDPITPPAWAGDVERHLPNSKRVVVRSGFHNFRWGACTARVASDFYGQLDLEGLDTSCLSSLPRPPFELPEEERPDTEPER